MCKAFTRMTIVFSMAVACMLVTPAVSAISDDSPATEIRTFWSQLDVQWNARDAARFSELFTEDAIFRFVDRGMTLEGRADVHEHFAERFPGFAAELSHLTRVDVTREIVPTVHFVDGLVRILRMQDGDAEPAVFREFAILAVMMKNDGHWKIHELRVFQLPE